MYNRIKEKKVAIVYPRVEGPPPPWENAKELSNEELASLMKTYRGIINNMGDNHPYLGEWTNNAHMLEVMNYNRIWVKHCRKKR